MANDLESNIHKEMQMKLLKTHKRKEKIKDFDFKRKLVR
jgi:hypothetical protein